MNNNRQILFIASNVPTPQRKLIRGVVLTIAYKLTESYNISVLHPSERVPFPLTLLKKYRNVSSSHSWENSGIIINPFKFFRLPGKKLSFSLLPFYKRKTKIYCKIHGIPALCHAHYVLPDAYFAYLIKKNYHTPYFISFRQSDQFFINKLSNKSRVFKMAIVALENADCIIVHNQAQKDYLSDLGFESILIAHGVDKSYLSYRTLLPKKNINITTIGDLIPLKHIDWVIKAVNDYRGKKEIQLSIIGQGYLKKELEACSSHERISFLGQLPQNRVAEILAKSDIFILPSFPETFGVAFIEAAAKSNAIIARKDAGVWGHFIPEEEMLFCDSYSNCQQRLYELIDDDEKRIKLSKAAFDRVSRQYTWDHIIEKYQKLYNMYISNPSNQSN